MMWQDFVFLAGSTFSLVVLAPTLTNRQANVPLGTSVPSSLIGFIYGTTFFTMEMTFSAVGAVLAGLMWSLIATFRSPGGSELANPTAVRDWLTDAVDSATQG